MFSLGGWAPLIRAGFRVPRPTRDTGGPRRGVRLRGSHPVPPGFPARSPPPSRAVPRSLDPGARAPRFRLLRVRSPLLAQSLLFSLPAGTEMFHFPACRPDGLCVRPAVPPHEGRGVAPFGDPRINACVPLPGDYRGLPRPSSPRDAKASAVRPCALGRCFPAAPRCSLPSLFSSSSVPRLFGFQRPPRPEAGNRSLRRIWWAWLDSNRRPRPYQGRALTT